MEKLKGDIETLNQKIKNLKTKTKKNQNKFSLKNTLKTNKTSKKSKNWKTSQISLNFLKIPFKNPQKT